MRSSRSEDYGGRTAYLAERTATLRDVQCRSHVTQIASTGCQSRGAPHLKHRPWNTAPIARLDFHDSQRQVPISVVGTQGGAGTSTVARLLNATDAGRHWPDPSELGYPLRVILTARTNAAGLMAASQALAAYCTAQHPEGPFLVGFVLVPDAPGRVPKQLNRRIRILASAAAVYRLPWVRAWRLCEMTPDQDAASRLAPGLLWFVEQAALATTPSMHDYDPAREPSVPERRRA